MILCHIVDDFVLQIGCLSNLKQKGWWEKNAPDKMYENDYKMALFIHCLEWSIMIHLPILLSHTAILWYMLAISITINCVIHYIVDDAKANKRKINLIQDQTIHFVQIIITFIVLIVLK